ncbi:MAG: ferritin-like domain-containing protein [Alphaproteobacteria bacterium]
MLASVKAAALVEANGAIYAAYLRNVFVDDPAFRDAASAWAVEEQRHGDVLGRWASLADPAFDYPASLARFRDGYSVPVDVGASVRGTRSGELIARCVVEAGTSSLYSAIAAASDEPVLAEICGASRPTSSAITNYFMTRFARISISKIWGGGAGS